MILTARRAPGQLDRDQVERADAALLADLTGPDGADFFRMGEDVTPVFVTAGNVRKRDAEKRPFVGGFGVQCDISFVAGAGPSSRSAWRHRARHESRRHANKGARHSEDSGVLTNAGI